MIIADLHPTLDNPPAIIIPAKSRRDKQRRRKAAYVVGMIILLDNGERCQIVAIDPKHGPACMSLPPIEE